MADAGDFDEASGDAVFLAIEPGLFLLVELVDEFAACRIGDDVDADAVGLVDHGDEGDGSLGDLEAGPFVPEAGPVVGGVDDGGAAANVDAPELDGGGVEGELGAEDGVFGGEEFEFGVARAGEVGGIHAGDEFAEAGVEGFAAAGGFGVEEATGGDELAEEGDVGVGELEGVGAVEEEDGGLEEVGEGGGGEGDGLPVEELGPLGEAGDVLGEIAHVVGVTVPVAGGEVESVGGAGSVFEFVDEDGGEAFGEVEEDEGGADGFVAIDAVGAPGARGDGLGGDELFGAFAVPVVLGEAFAEEAFSGEAAGAFEAVHVVEVPGVGFGVAGDAEVLAEPVAGAFEGVVFLGVGAAVGGAIGEEFVFTEADHGVGDDEGGDAGDGHGASAGVTAAACVAPASVGVLGEDPVLAGAFPDLAVDGDAGFLGFAEAEDGELTVAAVTAAPAAVAPGTGVFTGGDLPAFELVDEGEDASEVFLAVFGGGEGLDHEGGFVGVVGEFGLAEEVETFGDDGVVFGFAGVDEGEKGEAGGSDAPAGVAGGDPGAIGFLGALEVALAAVDRFEDLLAGEFGGGGKGVGGEQEEAGEQDAASSGRHGETFFGLNGFGLNGGGATNCREDACRMGGAIAAVYYGEVRRGKRGFERRGGVDSGRLIHTKTQRREGKANPALLRGLWRSMVVMEVETGEVLEVGSWAGKAHAFRYGGIGRGGVGWGDFCDGVGEGRWHGR